MKLNTEALLDAAFEREPDCRAMADVLCAQMARHASQADATGDIPPDFWSGLPVELLNRMNLPPTYGGLAITATALRRVALSEKIGRICPSLVISMPGPGLSMPPVLSLGTPEQKQRFFSLFTGQAVPVWGAFAITEAQGGSDATTMRTTAIRSDRGYVLNGTKCFISCGARAESVVVFATVDPSKGRFGIRAFIVPRGTPGFSVDRCEDMMGLRASQLAVLAFSDCEVPSENMLGHTGKRGPLIDAFTGAQGAWDYMRPALSSSINGYCAGILAHAESLLAEDQAGIARGRVAAAREDLAFFKAKTRASQLIALRAAWKYDLGGRSSLDASLAKASSASLAVELAHRLASLFPLHAVSKGSAIERFYRDAKAFDILEGTGDMQRLMIARAYAA